MNPQGKKQENRIKVSGTLSLEAALIFPLALMILLTFLASILAEQDALILSHALDQTAREIALLLPAADLLESLDLPGAWLEETIPDESLRSLLADGLSDVAATVLASPFVLQRVDRWAAQAAAGQGRSPPAGTRKLAIDFDLKRQTIWLCLSYETSNLMRKDWIEIRSRIPVWNAGLFSQSAGDSQEGRDGVWMLTNFERGQAIRGRFGGHLPLFYPVIALWDGHEAVSIKSMDWTAPSWQSPEAVKCRIDQLVAELSGFQGLGGEGPQPGQIRSRRLILVIPDNEISWKTGGLLASWQDQARSLGVILDIREYGTSRRYEPAR
ncbi:MAG: hypothetical protein WDA02_06970 [Saccharofermentanales bacterium]